MIKSRLIFTALGLGKGILALQLGFDLEQRRLAGVRSNSIYYIFNDRLTLMENSRHK